MSSKRVKLEDIAELTVGFVGNMAKQYTKEGVKFLRSLNIKPYRIVEDDLRYVSKEFSKSLNKSVLHHNDVIIVRTGMPGTCCVVPKNYEGCNCADVVLVRPNLKLVNPHYLAAYINVFGRRQIENNKVGAIQKHFNVRSAAEMLIDLPDLENQNKIAKVLCNLNEKIIKNEEINDYLEEMAKTIYNYWFVQFDFPDENGNPYKSSGGKMDFIKNFGLAPSNWKIGNLYDIAEFINGLACQKYRPTENEASLPVIKIKEMHDGISSDTERVKSSIPENNIVRTGDILFSWSASLEVQRWTGITGGLNQHIFKVIPKEKYSSSYVYHQLKSYVIKFIQMAEARKTTMGHITRDHLKQSVIILPPENIIRDFSNQVDNIHAEICRINKECQKLSQLRDWILPMLMNSQATIED